MKTPNLKKINQFTRGKIIGQWESVSNGQIGKNFTINYQTVNNIVNKSEGRVERRSGRPSKTSKREKRVMKRQIIKDRRLTNSEMAASFEK